MTENGPLTRSKGDRQINEKKIWTIRHTSNQTERHTVAKKRTAKAKFELFVQIIFLSYRS